MEPKLEDYLKADPETGKLYWIQSPNVKIKVGSEAGSLRKDGYIGVKFSGVCYKAHRVVYYLVNKHWPTSMLDHINGIKNDNRPVNLRVVSNAENCRNCKPSKNTSSIFKGVHWNKKLNKWQAQIRVNNKPLHLGVFTDEKVAATAYDKAATTYYGAFARLNFNKDDQNALRVCSG